MPNRILTEAEVAALTTPRRNYYGVRFPSGDSTTDWDSLWQDYDNLLHSLGVAREALREIRDDKEIAGEYIRRKARRALGGE